jgi:hypothetical protein
MSQVCEPMQAETMGMGGCGHGLRFPIPWPPRACGTGMAGLHHSVLRDSRFFLEYKHFNNYAQCPLQPPPYTFSSLPSRTSPTPEKMQLCVASSVRETEDLRCGCTPKQGEVPGLPAVQSQEVCADGEQEDGEVQQGRAAPGCMSWWFG